jgi:hypothetical protein
MTWFSIAIRRASIVDTGGLHKLWDSVYIVEARDRSEAWRRGIEIGYQSEEAYANAEGRQLRFAFAGVLTIDELGEDLTSGQEVYFLPRDIEPPLPMAIDTRFSPETLIPGCSGVGNETPE